MADNQSYERGTEHILLNGVGVTGASFGLAMVAGYSQFWLPRLFSFVTLIAGGTMTALTVNFEGSNDGTNWFNIGSNNSTSNAMTFVVDKPVRYVRANIATFTANTGTPLITVGVSA